MTFPTRPGRDGVVVRRGGMLLVAVCVVAAMTAVLFGTAAHALDAWAQSTDQGQPVSPAALHRIDHPVPGS